MLKILLRFESWWSNEGKNFDFSNQQMSIMEKFHFMKCLREQHGIQDNIADKLNYFKEKLNIIPKIALNESLFSGLPMPSNIWDNERSFPKVLMMVK